MARFHLRFAYGTRMRWWQSLCNTLTYSVSSGREWMDSTLIHRAFRHLLAVIGVFLDTLILDNHSSPPFRKPESWQGNCDWQQRYICCLWSKQAITAGEKRAIGRKDCPRIATGSQFSGERSLVPYLTSRIYEFGCWAIVESSPGAAHRQSSTAGCGTAPSTERRPPLRQLKEESGTGPTWVQ